MPDDFEHRLTLRRADQARTDFALIESDLEFLMQQIARLRGELWRVRLIGTLSGSALTTAALGLVFFLRWSPPRMAKFARMVLEAAVMAALAGLLTRG